MAAGTVERSDVPLPPAVEDWLRAHVEGFRGPARIAKFGFGQSNPTYRVTSTSGDYVLRRKPQGPLLAGAHMIEREFEVIRALRGSGVPVPHALAFCVDPAVLGTPFYVMEYVEGRIFYDQRLPGLPRHERAAVFDAMNEAVASLHLLDPAEVGLAGYGRPTAFIERQISLWTRQYRRSEGQPVAAMERLIDWLPGNVPPEQPARLFHGDLRLDNMIFHPTEPRVVALLDWELSTLGDPVADFAYHTMVWRIDADVFRGLGDLNRSALGIPEEDEYVRRYCSRIGVEALPSWEFYLAFAFFRVAAILQGVWRRAQDGEASAADAVQVGAKAGVLAEIGWRIARRASEGPR